MKDGIYRSDNALYYVLNKQILMKLMGQWYKTNENFMQGDYVEELPGGIKDEFSSVYSQVTGW